MAAELTAEELEELRDRLERLQVELGEQLGHLDAGAKPVDLDEPIGRLSRMEAMQQQKMAEASQRAAHQRLVRVRGALQAFERGDYGLCLRCEEDIGYKRLSARPETALCHACQSAKEKER